MCLIVHRPNAGAHVPNDIIESNLWLNDDGFGIAWREKDTLKYKKFAPSAHQQFKALLKKIDKTDNEYVAHFRMATHGPKDEEMAHPYIYKDKRVGDVLIFHNGIIPIKTASDKSDTWTFVNQVLKELPSKWWEKPAFRYLVSEGIGYSRLTVMTNDETVRLTGDNAWIYEGGIYYSTKPSAYYKYSGTGYSSSSNTGANGKGTFSKPVASEWTDEEWYEDYQNTWGQSSKFAGARKGQSVPDLYTPLTAGTAAVGSTWTHEGHVVEAIGEVDLTDGEAYGAAECQQCETEGEYYIIDNTVYIEIGHKNTDDTDGEGIADPKVYLLPEMASK